MSSTRTLEIFSSAQTAEIVRARLDAAGILAVVNGAEVASMFSNIGAAIAKVRLEVLPEDFDRAKAILAEDERQRSERAAWSCARCDEHNDAAFDLCWSCGKKRDDIDMAASPTSDADQFASPVDPVANEASVRPVKSDNPYAPTWVEPTQRSESVADDDGYASRMKNAGVVLVVAVLALVLLLSGLLMQRFF